MCRGEGVLVDVVYFRKGSADDCSSVSLSLRSRSVFDIHASFVPHPLSDCGFLEEIPNFLFRTKNNFKYLNN